MKKQKSKQTRNYSHMLLGRHLYYKKIIIELKNILFFLFIFLLIHFDDHILNLIKKNSIIIFLRLLILHNYARNGTENKLITSREKKSRRNNEI